MRKKVGIALASGMMAAAPVPAAAETPTLYAAGSLKVALSEVVAAYAAERGAEVKTVFGPSGLLKGRIEKGEPADVFASANMAHPRALEAKGLAGPVRPFARNRLCALAQPGVAVTPETLLDRLLDPKTRVGTSTPKADPSGDYAWQMFEKAEARRPGSYATLDAKALKLTGGPDSPKPPADRTIYGVVMAEKRADLFITYCTNALLAAREVAGLQVVAVPDDLNVGADYGLTVMKGREAAGGPLADYILSAKGQAVLTRYGFAPP